MNRYVGPERRRARRRSDGPQGDEPAEFDPVHIARVMRCPKCRQTFSTMRRWRMLCPECGHEWEEQSELSWGDKAEHIRSEAWGYLFIALAWAVLLACAGAIVGLFVLLFVWVTGLGASLVGGLVIVGFVVFILLGYAALMRPSMEATSRYQWWVSPWRGPHDRK